MTAMHILDSVVYEHLWSTPAARERFGERGRMQAWLEIIAALALTQADVGLVPASAAEEIAATADIDDFDLAEIAEGTRASGHSTLGIIRAWQRRLSPEAGEWIYWGATVQDVTDTWTGLVMRDVLDDADADLARLERALVALAREHRETVVLGRTHGQPGPADHVRLQGRRLAGGGPPPPRADRAGAPARRGRPARGGGRHVLVLGRARASSCSSGCASGSASRRPTSRG